MYQNYKTGLIFTAKKYEQVFQVLLKGILLLIFDGENIKQQKCMHQSTNFKETSCNT